MVEYNRGNAAIDAYDQDQANRRARRIDDENRSIAAADRMRRQSFEDQDRQISEQDRQRRIAEQDQQRRREQAVRDATSRGLSGVTSNDPVFNELRNAGPAAAPEAMNRYSETQSAEIEATRHAKQQADLFETRAIDALAVGDTAAFQHWASKSGMKVDPAIVQNRQAGKNLAVGAKTAEMFYRDSPQQAQAFTRAYVQTGRFEDAFAAAGQPPGRPLTVREVMLGGKRVLAGVDAMTGVAQPILMGGQPAHVPTPASASRGQDPAEVRTAQWIMQNMTSADGQQLDPNTAFALAKMAKTNPDKLWNSTFNSVYRSSQAFSEEERLSEARRAADAMLQGLQGAGGISGITPSGPAGIGTGAPQQSTVQPPGPATPSTQSSVRTYNPATGRIE